ncbi:MAG TPA: DUF3326 domain-containing protein [Thermoanaerobaculia bacterium]|nr:DUF3326 domain-containing protein [Thermoanaerobaculia bacterium]
MIGPEALRWYITAATSDELLVEATLYRGGLPAMPPASNVLYTEGYCIDLLAKGETDLYVSYANRVGLVIEHAGPTALDQVFNVVNSVGPRSSRSPEAHG